MRCLRWYQSPFGVDSGGRVVDASFGLLHCVFGLCLKMDKKRKAGGRAGTKCSSVPKTPHPLEVCVVFVALARGDEE